MWDLAFDPTELFGLNAQTCVNGCSAKAEELPKACSACRSKHPHQQVPIVIGNLKTITPAVAQRGSIDLEQCMKHAEIASGQSAANMAGIWAEVFERHASSKAPVDVDEDLYGGFHRKLIVARWTAFAPCLLTSVRTKLADRQPAFEDERLEELLFRYRARSLKTH